MRILITNDDSINARQLLPLIKWCKRFGDITAVVPKTEQSGKSHGIEIHSPFRVEQHILEEEITVYTVDSTPADCVRYAILGMNIKFDLVISGINRGLNIGSDMNYSGTVAAVREATINKVPAIAFSTSPEYYDNAVSHLEEIFEFITQNRLLEIHNAYNVNIPENPKGILITRQGGPYYSDTFDQLGNGMVKANGHSVYTPSNDLSLDTDATMSGYISITPLSINMTCTEVFEKLTNQTNE